MPQEMWVVTYATGSDLTLYVGDVFGPYPNKEAAGAAADHAQEQIGTGEYLEDDGQYQVFAAMRMQTPQDLEFYVAGEAEIKADADEAMARFQDEHAQREAE